MSDDDRAAALAELVDAARYMLFLIRGNPDVAARWTAEDVAVLERTAKWLPRTIGGCGV